ncbi:unnamed protein product [Blepharisma stoltei]|uniref:Uncharacterized protein n=1 Tax=Blepharisma stoltei TaxID=1481888 RepID=A0AAU9IKH2_9CILI|nr:unnamed protein product [Blepharisma stoltei]
MEGQNLDISDGTKIQSEPSKEDLTSENSPVEALDTKESMDLSDKNTEEMHIEMEESKDSGEEKVFIGSEIITQKDISEVIHGETEIETEQTKLIDATVDKREKIDEIDEDFHKTSQETEENFSGKEDKENNQIPNNEEKKSESENLEKAEEIIISSENSIQQKMEAEVQSETQIQIISKEEFIIEKKSPIDLLEISKEEEKIIEIEKRLQTLLFSAEILSEQKFSVSSQCIIEPLFYNSVLLEPLKCAQYCRIEPLFYDIIEKTSIFAETKLITEPLFYEKVADDTIEALKFPKIPLLEYEVIREDIFSPKSKQIIQPLSIEKSKETCYDCKLKEKSHPLFIEKSIEYENHVKPKKRISPLLYEKNWENIVEIKPKIRNQPLFYEKIEEIAIKLEDKTVASPFFLEKSKEFAIEINRKRNIQPLFYEKHNECSIKIELKKNIEPVLIENPEINNAEQGISEEIKPEECPFSAENAIIEREANHAQIAIEPDTRTQNIFQINETSFQEESQNFEPNKEPEPTKESTPKYEKPPEPGFYDLDISGAGNPKHLNAVFSNISKIQEKQSQASSQTPVQVSSISQTQNPPIHENIYEETETVEELEPAPQVQHHKQQKVKSKKPPPKIVFTDSVGANIEPVQKPQETSQQTPKRQHEEKKEIVIPQSPEVITDMNKIKPHRPISQKQPKPEIRSNAGCGKCIII